MTHSILELTYQPLWTWEGDDAPFLFDHLNDSLGFSLSRESVELFFIPKRAQFVKGFFFYSSIMILRKKGGLG